MPNDTFSKKQIQNVFYRRPTLSWDLKCEFNGHTRADAYQALQRPDVVTNKSHESIISLALFILALACMLTPLYIFNVWTKQNGRIGAFSVVVIVSFQILSVLILQIDVRLTDENSPTIDKMVERMDVFNICADAYTKVDIDLYRDELNRSAGGMIAMVWSLMFWELLGLVASVPPILLNWTEKPKELNLVQVHTEQ